MSRVMDSLIKAKQGKSLLKQTQGDGTSNVPMALDPVTVLQGCRLLPTQRHRRLEHPPRGVLQVLTKSDADAPTETSPVKTVAEVNPPNEIGL